MPSNPQQVRATGGEPLLFSDQLITFTRDSTDAVPAVFDLSFSGRHTSRPELPLLRVFTAKTSRSTFRSRP